MSSPLAPSVWLASHGAQGDVVDGLKPYADWPTLWARCPRGDWLFGIAERVGVAHEQLVRTAIACARLALPLLAAPLREHAEAVLASAAAWCEDPKTGVDTSALESTFAPDPASDAAARAAVAVGLGVASRDVLVSAVAAAAEAMILATYEGPGGVGEAMKRAHELVASAVRAGISYDDVAARLDAPGARDDSAAP